MTDQPPAPTPDPQYTGSADSPSQPTSVPPGRRRVLPPPAPEGTELGAGSSPLSGVPWQLIAVPLVALVIATVALVWLLSGPDETSFADTRAGIESQDTFNNENTAGAPQQEVVNGWTTIEYLNLLSMQQEHDNNRRDALLFLILVSGLAAYTHHHLTRSRPSSG